MQEIMFGKFMQNQNGDINLLNKKDKVYPYLFWKDESYDIWEMNEGLL